MLNKIFDERRLWVKIRQQAAKSDRKEAAGTQPRAGYRQRS
jgi:hypothetical protein